MESQPPAPAPAPAEVPIAAPAPCWSNIVKTQAPPKPVKDLNAANRVFVESCKSSKGIAVAVVDANAIIEGGERLIHCADKFVSVPEVRDEIRDPMSRHRLAFIPFTVEPLEPSPEALHKVVKFAKATGDLQTLSDVDLKLIALTYTLESQIHGTSHLRDNPPPIHSVNVKRLPEKELPGWGSNVPNLDEWEALEQEDGEGLIPNSRILPLKDLNLNVIPSDDHSEDVSVGNKSYSHSENKDDVQGSFQNHKRYLPKKKEINIEGKMVADGIDASQGQVDDNAGDWMPAVSRSTHRRFLRRKARRELYEASSEKDDQQVVEENMDANILEAKDSDQFVHQTVEKCVGNGLSEESGISVGKDSDENHSILKQVRLEEAISGEHESNSSSMVEATSENNVSTACEENGVDIVNEGLDQLEISSQTNESINDGSYADDDSSEQSWMLRSMSESSVACVTTDFAMQNVLLQMGLRLLAPGGMQIRELHRWILKCHACYTVTAEIGRIFCPKCGNGGTLRKVAVTVGENGVVLASRRPRITLRGTKFSLPLPKGGRDAVTKNVVLREDQLPQKFLRPKTKKANKEGDEFFTPDSLFTHHTDKRSPLQPPVRQALAVFSGKRNPNDNHYSRSKQNR